MSTLVVVSLVAALTSIAFRLHGRREVRLVRMARVAAPPETVLDLVSQVEYMPEWHLRPSGLPRQLRPATLAVWGQSIQPRDRLCAGPLLEREALQLRSIPGREFGYRRCSRGALRYESVFRVAPTTQDGDTELRWEVHYKLLRGVDAVNPGFARREAWLAMDESLESIRILAESIAAKPNWRKSQQIAS